GREFAGDRDARDAGARALPDPSVEGVERLIVTDHVNRGLGQDPPQPRRALPADSAMIGVLARLPDAWSEAGVGAYEPPVSKASRLAQLSDDEQGTVEADAWQIEQRGELRKMDRRRLQPSVEQAALALEVRQPPSAASATECVPVGGMQIGTRMVRGRKREIEWPSSCPRPPPPSSSSSPPAAWTWGI